ncbi:UNVERIFIED_CONTAM: hypothetical protein PYX00_006950 [Menopon gallinae]|uniref:peptidylprolyl isomerase n=1 Tax=Menopon gallinae TaxID=328185 RepID=A0AAW2HH47_9NEOP
MARFFDDENDDLQEIIEGETLFSKPQRLVEGINLKELFSGKDVLFQFKEQYDDYMCDDFNVSCDTDEAEDLKKPKTHAELRKRGGPDPKLSFKEISSSMTCLDPNGYVKKEIITPGSGPPPSDYCRVTVDYSFYKEHDQESFDSTYLRGKPARLCLSIGEIIPGLELAIRSMKRNENSRFLIKWEAAFGRQGCPPRIGKECDILADVTLLDYVDFAGNYDKNALTEAELSSVTFEQSLKDAKNYHCLGNEEFSLGRIKCAIKSYRKAIRSLDEMRLANQEEEEKMLALKVKCLVNLAVCYNKIQRCEHACVACRDALSIEPNNVKATFQYGKANLTLSNFNEAEKWLMEALRLKPDDEDIKKTIKKLDEKVKAAKVEDTVFCRKAFSKLSCDSKKTEDEK